MYRTRACYDESKRVGETLCNIFHKIKGVHTNTIRPFNVFGPGMQETDYRVLPNFTSRIKGKIPLQIYGTGNQTRTFCYITDAMEGFIRVILKWSFWRSLQYWESKSRNFNSGTYKKN